MVAHSTLTSHGSRISKFKATKVAYVGELDPPGTLDQGVHRVLLCLGPADNMVSRPVHPAAGSGTGPTVVVLGVVQRVKEIFSVPRHPTLRLDQVSDGRFHDDGPRVCLPWPAKVVAELQPLREQRLVRDDAAVLDHQRGGLLCLRSPMSR